jgi:hypothetical protein
MAAKRTNGAKLHEQGLSQRQIAAAVGEPRRTVRDDLATEVGGNPPESGRRLPTQNDSVAKTAARHLPTLKRNVSSIGGLQPAPLWPASAATPTRHWMESLSRHRDVSTQAELLVPWSDNWQSLVLQGPRSRLLHCGWPSPAAIRQAQPLICPPGQGPPPAPDPLRELGVPIHGILRLTTTGDDTRGERHV